MRVIALLLTTVCTFVAVHAEEAGIDGTTATVTAVELACPGSPVTVIAPDRRLADTACEAAADAARYLSSFGLDTGRHFTLRIVSSLPAGTGPGQVGCYDRSRREAWVLIESGCGDPEAMFGLPLSPPLYRSLVVHEVAHAIADANFSDHSPGMVAHEYIAYVTQLASLPKPLRQQILARHPPSAMESVLFLNSYIYLMDPGAFAAIAWRHHQGVAGGAPFIRAVLEGRALADPW